MTCPCPQHPFGCYGHPETCGCPKPFNAEREIKRMKRALQRIADLPEPDKLSRPYRHTPKQIAIHALKRLSVSRPKSESHD